MQDKQYENIKTIYASPYSKIFCGRECDTGQLVILKTGGQDTMTPEATERLRREYRMLLMVNSPHVVRTLGEVTLDGRYYLKEEFCPGSVLRQLIQPGGDGVAGLLPDSGSVGRRAWRSARSGNHT